jgi:PleD family two-component response regulator
MQPGKDSNYEQLIAKTNQALYLAKRRGRNQVATDKDCAV